MSRDRMLADEATRRILDRIGLATYLYAVRLEGRECVVDLEHPARGAWRRVILRAAASELLASLDDASRREALAAAWDAELARADAA